VTRALFLGVIVGIFIVSQCTFGSKPDVFRVQGKPPRVLKHLKSAGMQLGVSQARSRCQLIASNPFRDREVVEIGERRPMQSRSDFTDVFRTMTAPTDSTNAPLTFSGHEYFRHRLVLSILSGRPVRIDKIRSADANPGLRGPSFLTRRSRVYATMLSTSDFVNRLRG